VSPVRAHFPTTVRVDVAALAERAMDVEAALDAALGRAIATAASALAASGRALGVPVAHAPEIRWTGDAAGAVPDAVRAVIEARIRAVVASRRS
jgi:hypothetical protein